LRRLARAALACSLALLCGLPFAARANDPTLPDLDGGGQSDISIDNVAAAAALEYAALLEDLKVFSVADQIVQQFEGGVLPPSSDAGTGPSHFVVQYQRARAAAPGADQRRRLYEGLRPLRADAPWAQLSSAFASLSGAPAQRSAAVREIVRFLRVASQAGKPARGVAHALSAWIVAADELLDSPEIQRAYGAADRWSLIDRISRRSLGHPAAPPARFTTARARHDVMLWLAHALAKGPHTVPAALLGEARHLVAGR
jgi:hypothetical protein